ncbi:Transcriptional activator DEMETER [Apostasia shenzhenica]|uniref:Transcriptional activator DEMETER n=1 Tax=Apostasia shenzhenica TaxID=1088818 RepID=A0A2I0B174_9ASPA|nr:Transcriptional activator DEMETER [Apostasia shenzhenica]
MLQWRCSSDKKLVLGVKELLSDGSFPGTLSPSSDNVYGELNPYINGRVCYLNRSKNTLFDCFSSVDMDFDGDFPCKKDFEIEHLWQPTTPAKSTRSGAHNRRLPCQHGSWSPLDETNQLDLTGSPAAAEQPFMGQGSSSGDIVLLQSPATCSCNTSSTIVPPPFAPKVDPSQENWMHKGKATPPTRQYIRSVTCLPNLNSSAIEGCAAPPTPSTAKECVQSMEDKQVPLEVIDLDEEEETEENLMTKEESSVQIALMNPEKYEENDCIDLNTTSKQKLKRKCFRPKVVTEGKRARTATKLSTPNPETPELARWEENLSCKQTYVRRKKDFISSSVRRCLSFDLQESIALGENSAAMLEGKQNLETTSLGDFDLKNSTCQMQNRFPNLTEIPVQYAAVHRSMGMPKILFPASKSSVRSYKELARAASFMNSADYASVSAHCSAASPKGEERGHCLILEDSKSGQKKSTHSYNLRRCAGKVLDSGRQEPCLPEIQQIERTGSMQIEPTTDFSTELESTPPNRRKAPEMLRDSNFCFADVQQLMAQARFRASVGMLSFSQASNVQKDTALDNKQPSTNSFKPLMQKNKDIIQKSNPENTYFEEHKMGGNPAQLEISKEINNMKFNERGKIKDQVHPSKPSSSSIYSAYDRARETLCSNDTSPTLSYAEVSRKKAFSDSISFMDAVNDVVWKLRRLNISNCLEPASSQAQNALAPYVGDESMLVPYLKKRRRPRAKVELDSETNRVWMLLMGRNEDDETEDVDKDKWWEEERRVFRGRVDSFIARMRLVQGDRRFSQWKGSVVDSVVGVFLTQNVSDHLSSSAFMSLAANFPLRTISEANAQETATTFEQNGSTTSLADILNFQRNILDHGFCYQSSSEADFAEVDIKKEASKCSEIPIGSCTEKCEASHEKEVAECSRFQELNGQKISKTECQEKTCGEIFEATGEKRCESEANMVESIELQELISSSENETAIGSNVPIPKHHAQQTGSSEMEDGANMQPFGHGNAAAGMNNENSNICSNFQNEDMKSSQQHDGNLKFLAGKTPEAVCNPDQMENDEARPTQASNSNGEQKLAPAEKVNPSMKDRGSKIQKISAGIPKIGTKDVKRRAGTEKSAYDWEDLRKEIHRNKPADQQRSRDKMDSVDWEAVRCADACKVAETIRERGMNNVLAERIKEFLDRLVKEHGSIDLEWLRDVSPDKAKDYLLSIRGLGLKSAECVRLLTLHHLAFPVDTNVGRICVRLGWVPLQPLPESLQLHLLELYPVLESIQKYELHYQMITFGKVFCTKSKPNCNACPMRGECRHFASAFASARLALPAPEDRSIVSFTAPIASKTGEAPIPAPSSVFQLEGIPTSGYPNLSDTCEPIIQEPTSPEVECPETLEKDIEDAFLEDQDEIPTIKLNLEAFSQNIQNYMQEHAELQDGDLSKALVALTPEVASIPMPKLKNVSRLRTEHQVYEIPDSHLLLEGVDRREADDPCPYLLAIWSPGKISAYFYHAFRLGFCFAS